MQYDVNSPKDYMEALEKDWRFERLEEIRQLIKQSAPQIVEGIKYKMLSYADENGDVFHLNAQKSYVALYVGDIEKIDATGTLLKGLSLGKGCIRIKKDY